MATEEIKKQNQLRLTNMALATLASAVWETLGDSSLSFSGLIGGQVLKIMEKEMGLEIAGESPKAVLTEIARIFVDEFGFAEDISVEGDEKVGLTMKVHNCANRKFTDILEASGVEKPFICPIMNASQAGLRRMGYKMREDVKKWADGGGSIITFTSI